MVHWNEIQCHLTLQIKNSTYLPSITPCQLPQDLKVLVVFKVNQQNNNVHHSLVLENQLYDFPFKRNKNLNHYNQEKNHVTDICKPHCYAVQRWPIFASLHHLAVELKLAVLIAAEFYLFSLLETHFPAEVLHLTLLLDKLRQTPVFSLMKIRHPRLDHDHRVYLAWLPVAVLGMDFMFPFSLGLTLQSFPGVNVTLDTRP